MFSSIRAQGEIKHFQQMISRDRLALGFYWGFTGQLRYLMDKTEGTTELALRRMLSHTNAGFSSSVSNTLRFASKISTPFFLLFVCFLSKGCFLWQTCKHRRVE